jgi:cbb3-type cytochrome oxidase subunit 3
VTYKIRNTLALGVVWLVIVLLGLAVWAFWQPRQIKKINKETQAINKQLEDLPGLTDDVQRLTAQYLDVKRRYDSRSKEIPQFDISSQTYGYMSQGIDEAGFLKFDMKFMGTYEKVSWGYNAYKLTQGEAQFENLFKFVYFLENGRRLYKIASMRLDQKEAIDPDTKEVTSWIAFEMEIHAFFVHDIPELGTSLAAQSLTMIPSPYDPFHNMITQTLATEPPPGEINADQILVKAVLPGKAFVLTEKALVVLHLGDKVWRGYVTRVNPAESAVEFTLDEGGVVRKLTKKILFEKR